MSNLLTTIQVNNVTQTIPEVKLLPYSEVPGMIINSRQYIKAENIIKKAASHKTGCDCATSVQHKTSCTSDEAKYFRTGLVFGKGIAVPDNASLESPRSLLIYRQQLLNRLAEHNYNVAYHYQQREELIKKLEDFRDEHDIGKFLPG